MSIAIGLTCERAVMRIMPRTRASRSTRASSAHIGLDIFNFAALSRCPCRLWGRFAGGVPSARTSGLSPFSPPGIDKISRWLTIQLDVQRIPFKTQERTQPSRSSRFARPIVRMDSLQQSTLRLPARQGNTVLSPFVSRIAVPRKQFRRQPYLTVLVASSCISLRACFGVAAIGAPSGSTHGAWST
jgi:hypothetical protein